MRALSMIVALATLAAAGTAAASFALGAAASPASRLGCACLSLDAAAAASADTVATHVATEIAESSRNVEAQALRVAAEAVERGVAARIERAAAPTPARVAEVESDALRLVHLRVAGGVSCVQHGATAVCVSAAPLTILTTSVRGVRAPAAVVFVDGVRARFRRWRGTC